MAQCCSAPGSDEGPGLTWERDTVGRGRRVMEGTLGSVGWLRREFWVGMAVPALRNLHFRTHGRILGHAERMSLPQTGCP